MAILAIRVYPDPVLRTKTRPVTEFGPALARLAANMIETMVAAPGIGLAAPQVGEEVRMAVVDLSVGEDPAQLHVLVNPEIVWREGLETDVEGCLSLPGISDKVDRPTAIRMRAVDLAGRPFELGAEEEAAELRTLIDAFNELHPETLRIADECHRKVAETLAGPSTRDPTARRRKETAAA